MEDSKRVSDYRTSYGRPGGCCYQSLYDFQNGYGASVVFFDYYDEECAWQVHVLMDGVSMKPESLIVDPEFEKQYPFDREWFEKSFTKRWYKDCFAWYNIGEKQVAVILNEIMNLKEPVAMKLTREKRNYPN